MQVGHKPQVRAWKVALVLLCAYALYVPHLFLTVNEIPSGALAGPVSGLEYLLGFGIAFWLLVPLFGDLSFWVASVLFAMRQFRRALIVGAVGFGLCATFYALPLVEPYLRGDPAATSGGLGAIALRLASMGLLLGCAWRFDTQERVAASSQSDHPDPSLESSETADAWRDHDLLKVKKGATLPQRCLRCNAPAGGYQVTRRLTWASPLWGCIIISVSPLVIGFIVFIVVYNIVCWRGQTTAFLCPRHRKQARRAIQSTWLTALVGVVVLVTSAVAAPKLQPALVLIGCLTLFVAVPARVFAARVLVPARMDRHYIWLRRVGPKYLGSLPEWGG
jgi:hypothetical protein